MYYIHEFISRTSDEIFRNQLVVTLYRSRMIYPTPAALVALTPPTTQRIHTHTQAHIEIQTDSPTDRHLAHICALYWLHIFILQFDKNSLWATQLVVAVRAGCCCCYWCHNCCSCYWPTPSLLLLLLLVSRPGQLWVTLNTFKKCCNQK